VLILEREDATEWAGLTQQDLRSPDAVFKDPTRPLDDATRPFAWCGVAERTTGRG
jgi:hypothetical protein